MLEAPSAIVVDAELRPCREETHIMGMAALVTVTTIEELLALPEDGLRHELLDGVHVVTPSPAYGHQEVLSRLHLVFGNALAGRPGLKVLFSPADVALGPRTLVQPDLFVIRFDPAAPPASWESIGVPILVVEVVSPGTAARDRGSKRGIYQRAGVAEYWIVDLDARLIERWTPTDVRPEIIAHELRWPHPGEPIVNVLVPELFGPPGPGRPEGRNDHE